MSDIRAAADEARKLVKMFSAVKVISETFDAIADLESLELEIRGRLAGVQEIEAAEVAKRKAIIAQTNAIKEEAEELLSKAKVEAAGIRSEANDAKERIKGSIASFLSDLEHLKGQHVLEVSHHSQVLVELEKSVAAKTSELWEVETKIAAAKAEIQKIFS